MESLAVLVAVLFLIDVLAGPVALLLTWGKLLRFISSQSKNVVLVLTVIRRIVHGFLVIMGVLIGTWLTFIAVTPAKLFGLFSIVTSYMALRREYFSDLFILGDLFKGFGLKGKNGRSSGRDGHGPGGQS
jgi:hypothetical protein